MKDKTTAHADAGENLICRHEPLSYSRIAGLTGIDAVCRPVCRGIATSSENKKSLTINRLTIVLLKIGAKKSIANDRQIFPLFPDLIDIVTHLIVIYLFHFLHFPTSNTVVYGYKSTK